MYFSAEVDLLLNDKELKLDESEVYNFKISALDFCVELCKEISKRFKNNPYLKYCSIFTPKNSTSGDVMSIATFKNLLSEINVDVELVNLEWQLLSDTHHLKKIEDLTAFWSAVWQEKNIT